MSPEEVVVALFRTLTEQLTLPEGYEWTPLAGLGALTVCGLILLVRGAKWAPAMAALAFLAIGGGGGAALANAIGTPLWPTVGVTGVVGFILGLTMFRFWQALLLASCFIIAGLSTYYARGLTPAVEDFLSSTPQNGQLILPAAGEVVGDNPTGAWTKAQDLWRHLDANVPNFSQTAWILISVTGLAGLIFGLLLPGVSRALWAATFGTLFFGVGVTAGLNQFTPDALAWLKTNTDWAWTIVGAVWCCSMAVNLIACRKKKNAVKSDNADDEPKKKPALA